MRFLCGVLVALAVSAANAQDYPAGQLPEGVTPTHYALELTILPEKDTFSGRTVIDVTLDAPAEVIWLHGQDLTVASVSVTDAAGAIAATWTEIPDSDGVAKLTLSRPAAAGSAKIEVAYTAPFNRALEGLYRTDEDGNAYAFTQMEPISARLAFPGFDEPRFKTPFDTTLIIHAGHVGISNTPVAREENLDGGLKKLVFQTSKPLPTYLIAFAVGPLDVVEWEPIPATATRDFAIPLRGVTAKGKGEMIRYALSHTGAILTTLEDYFGTAYPYEKLDLIAAIDFAAGAMENAGAIVYREQLMLLDESSPLAAKRRYALVHAHELAHQWFGNLVTPAWWNDIWLNESFASWMGNKATAAWDPKGEYGRLTLEEALRSMELDSWRSARRIAEPVTSNDDIQNAFDAITYLKGGGVLSMFEQYYGEENFRKGVQLHMQRFRFGVATAADLLQSIADASNADAAGVEAFQTFLNQAGVPVLRTQVRCGSTPSVLVSQNRYTPAQLPDARPTRDQSWNIPLCVSYGDAEGRRQTCGIVTQRRQDVPLEGSCPAWVMPNADGAGYYRFFLPERDWDSLTANAAALTAKETLAALDSLEAAFEADEMEVDKYLDRVKALVTAGGGLPAHDVASAPMTSLIWLLETMVPESGRPGARKYINDLYGPVYAQLGLDPNTTLDRSNPVQATLTRTPVVNMVALYGRMPEVRAELAGRGAAYLGVGGDGKIFPEAVDASLVEQAVIVAVQDLGAPVVQAIFGHLRTERNAIVRQRLLTALTRATDPAVAAEVRALALSPDLRVNEVPILVYGSVREPANADAAWRWFKANFDAIRGRLPVGAHGNLPNIGRGFCTKADRDDFRSFFDRVIDDLQGGPRTLAQTLERIDSCRALVDKQRRNSVRYFARLARP